MHVLRKILFISFSWCFASIGDLAASTMLMPLGAEIVSAWQQALPSQHKNVQTKTAQEAAYETFFQFMKDQAVLYKPRSFYRVGTVGRKVNHLASNIPVDVISTRLLYYQIFAVLLSFFFSANVCAMELVDRLPRKTFSKANNRRYEKVSCFPCGKKKKSVMPTRKELDIITSKKLLEAVKKGNTKEVYFNCSYGNAINIKDEHGFAPLHYAVGSLLVKISETLLSVSHINLESTTPQGFTALQMLQHGRASLEKEEDIKRCDTIIGLIHTCYQKKEKKRERRQLYVFTEDIGDQEPVEDRDGKLWISKNGGFHICGYVRNEEKKGEDIDIEEVNI